MPIMKCCVTGHRPEKFPFVYDEACESYAVYSKLLYNTVEELIQNGYRHFITGMAKGVDLDFANAVLFYKQKYLDFSITLEAAIPCPSQTRGWDKKYLSLYKIVLDHADKVTYVSDRYFAGCMQKRNMYMVDNSDLVLAVWNGIESGGTFGTVKYAKRKDKIIKYIMLTEFK